ERFAQIEEGGFWEWDEKAIIGRPQVLERPSGLTFQHEEIALVGAIPDSIAVLRPIPSSASPECLLLGDDGQLFRVNPGHHSIDRLMNALDSGMTHTSKWLLQVSPGGEMAAIVEARGRYGVVLDLAAGRPKMRLDRGGCGF